MPNNALGGWAECQQTDLKPNLPWMGHRVTKPPVIINAAQCEDELGMGRCALKITPRRPGDLETKQAFSRSFKTTPRVTRMQGSFQLLVENLKHTFIFRAKTFFGPGGVA